MSLEDEIGLDSPRSANTRPEPVKVNIYDIGTSGRSSIVNTMLRPFGAGAFHCGVEVYGLEWSFSDIATDLAKDVTMLRSGVFSSWPKNCKGHRYSETVEMGLTQKTEVQVLMMISKMEEQWQVATYDVLRKNCCHFVDELCVRLGVGHIPPLLLKLAELGSSIVGAASTNCCATKTGESKASHMPCCDGFGVVDGVRHDVEVDQVQSIPVLTELPEVIEQDATPYLHAQLSPRYGRAH
eukprot:TRINITY_DN19786_c0_g1_i1.p1 TRINITY_DN19786_c0_g1~~TRINITY_DN19786_c0_g1_i1.p1  ORF type:complete len:280 (-),score=37.11 TRINITY_DN19786_c0_g1_i1:16-732(-)